MFHFLKKQQKKQKQHLNVKNKNGSALALPFLFIISYLTLFPALLNEAFNVLAILNNASRRMFTFELPRLSPLKRKLTPKNIEMNTAIRTVLKLATSARRQIIRGIEPCLVPLQQITREFLKRISYAFFK